MATSNEKQVQLKRESLLNNDIILEDVFPKTMTDAVVDINTGAKMSDVLDTLITIINNKLSRNVNSVNGRSGVVILDASDVGLGNVDNVSTADLKAWVINYVASQFHEKRLILQDYYSGIEALIETNNDAYDGVPFVCQHYTEDTNDEKMVIGYMYNDGNHLTSECYTFDFGDKGVGRFEYDSNDQVLGEYFNVYDGPKQNHALGLYSTSKGYGNITRAQASMICGNENTIDIHGENTFVTGNHNTVTGNKNGIVCGDGNTVTDIVYGSSIVGGYENTNINGSSYNMITGSSNRVDGGSSGNIVSGYFNELSSMVNHSCIVGCENRIADRSQGSNPYDIRESTSSLVFGQGNRLEVSRSCMIGGTSNTIYESRVGICSGLYNKADSSNSFLMFGELNMMQDNKCSIVGGYQSTVSESYSFALGNKVEAKGENSVIFGISSNGLNPETVGSSERYAGVLNMTIDEIMSTYKTTPFSIAYGDASFVMGKDNLGIGDLSFTSGTGNINQSTNSFVCGINNKVAPAKGLIVSGTNNYIIGNFSKGTGLRNTTSGHVANVCGAFNNAENYVTTVGIGSTVDFSISTSTDVDLYFNTNSDPSNTTMKAFLIRKETYIDIPVPFMFCPIKATGMVFKLKYQDTNEWSGNTVVDHIISENLDDIFEWIDDTKCLRISRNALNTEFNFNHSVTPGETSYELDILDLRDVEFEISITFEPNFADRVSEHAFKVGNGPFADAIYRTKACRANAFEVNWDGTTRTQKDIKLQYKEDPNTNDPPVDISFKKLIDVLIANGTISHVNDIVDS